jgi:hypothetical protein
VIRLRLPRARCVTFGVRFWAQRPMLRFLAVLSG